MVNLTYQTYKKKCLNQAVNIFNMGVNGDFLSAASRWWMR